MKRNSFFRSLICALALALLAISPAYSFDNAAKKGIETAIAAQGNHTGRLMAIQGVVGTAIGFNGDGNPEIIIFTESSAHPELPKVLDNIPVKVEVTGRFFALAPPTANASFAFACIALTCSFDGSSSTGRRLDYEWDLGDGSPLDAGVSTTHAYSAAGSYSVTLTVTDKDGNSDTTNQDANPTEPSDNCLETGDTTIRCQRPVPGGVSIGHPSITAGTVGGRVIDSIGNYFLLSNNHVLANSNDASVGDDALQPGPFDGGVSADAIGSLFDWEPLIFDPASCDVTTGTGCNKIDAAIASASSAELDNQTHGYGMPNAATVPASIGLLVKKDGRTTGLTEGEVSGINATVDVCYEGTVTCTKAARFVGQIIITPGSFSAGGDSGSMIVTQNNNNPVGLLFAGSSSHTIANTIDFVLSHFEVTIDGAAANLPPAINIDSPTDGATFTSGSEIQFSGTANDPEQGDLTTVLVWTSDIDGQIGEGGNFSNANLSDGTHIITVSAIDSEGAIGSRSVSITLGSQATSPIANVSSITYATEGGKNNDRHLRVTPSIEDGSGNPVGGASVSVSLENSTQTWTGTATTGSGGTVAFTLKNAASDCYTTVVTNVEAGTMTWDASDPANTSAPFCK